MGMTVFVDVWALFLAAMLRRWRWGRGGGGGGGKNEWLCYLCDLVFYFFFEFCYYSVLLDLYTFTFVILNCLVG